MAVLCIIFESDRRRPGPQRGRAELDLDLAACINRQGSRTVIRLRRKIGTVRASDQALPATIEN